MQDISNVFGAVFNPKAGDTASGNYQAPDPSYTEPNVAPPPSEGYDAPETEYTPGTGAPLQGARVKKQINSAPSGIFQVAGKPPVSIMKKQEWLFPSHNCEKLERSQSQRGESGVKHQVQGSSQPPFFEERN